MDSKRVEFSDVSLRDGTQSLWAMKMTHGMADAVSAELDQAGYDTINIAAAAPNFKMLVRAFNEDPWEYVDVFKRKITKTKKCMALLDCLELSEFESPEMIRMFHEMVAEKSGAGRVFTLANARNELDRCYPWLMPIARDIGLEIIPCVCFYPSPRRGDDYYADLVDRLMEYQPEQIMLKDAGGLLTLERIRTLLPAMQNAAKGTPIELHTHGMSTYQGLVVVEGMKLGVDRVHTCVPPLACGSSHMSIFAAITNARALGLEHNIVDTDCLKIVEERLTRIADVEGLPKGAPIEYDHRVFSHQVPGGVISNLKSQLNQMGIGHKLDEVLEEVVLILEDLGHPIMISPASQFIVSQAAVNVATGERYKEVLDCMIETALGVWGWEDAGVPWMKAEVKDRFLSHPNAKALKQRHEQKQEMAAQRTVKKLRASYGMTNAADEDFMLYHIMRGDNEIKKIRPPKSYYSGKEPLAHLLKELSKDQDISRLHLRKGDSVFDFHRTTDSA